MKSEWLAAEYYNRQRGDVVLTSQNNLVDEAYRLQVKSNGVQIKASSGAGFFYAFQTLNQLMPPLFFGQKKDASVHWGVQSVDIFDQPTFKWRGYMLDVSRHFFDKEQVKDVIDFMAASKLNRFHWHLADDQGWRLEIKSYPKVDRSGCLEGGL